MWLGDMIVFKAQKPMFPNRIRTGKWWTIGMLAVVRPWVLFSATGLWRSEPAIPAHWRRQPLDEEVVVTLGFIVG